MDSTPTPHNSARKGDFAKIVLMPGDPLRAKFIAEKYLDDAVLVNNVRGVQGYTGYYKGIRLSVMAHNMGMPSMGIYSYELFKFYDVDIIMRVGSLGALSDALQLKDIVLASNAISDSNYMQNYALHGDAYIETASPELINVVANTAQKISKKIVQGMVYSSDNFYAPEGSLQAFKERGAIGVECETSALYYNARILGKKAVCLLSVSDNPLKGTSISSDERQVGFTNMFELALESAKEFYKLYN